MGMKCNGFFGAPATTLPAPLYGALHTTCSPRHPFKGQPTVQKRTLLKYLGGLLATGSGSGAASAAAAAHFPLKKTAAQRRAIGTPAAYSELFDE